eukprot:scaffold69324_cov56-Attheya_sp.AAC.2
MLMEGQKALDDWVHSPGKDHVRRKGRILVLPKERQCHGSRERVKVGIGGWSDAALVVFVVWLVVPVPVTAPMATTVRRRQDLAFLKELTLGVHDETVPMSNSDSAVTHWIDPVPLLMMMLLSRMKKYAMDIAMMMYVLCVLSILHAATAVHHAPSCRPC